MDNSFWAFLLMLTPVVETRGGIPTGLVLGVSPATLVALSAIAATIIFLIVRTALEQFYTKVAPHWPFASRQITRLQLRATPYVKRFGIPGLILFVAIPLPGTGVYGGTGASWILGLDRRKSFFAVLCGALISAGIIIAICEGIFS